MGWIDTLLGSVHHPLRRTLLLFLQFPFRGLVSLTMCVCIYIYYTHYRTLVPSWLDRVWSLKESDSIISFPLRIWNWKRSFSCSLLNTETITLMGACNPNMWAQGEGNPLQTERNEADYLRNDPELWCCHRDRERKGGESFSSFSDFRRPPSH